MGRQERDKLRAEVEGFGTGQGGLSEVNIAKTLARSILLLDESNELSFKVNSALTVVLLLVALLQAWLMTTGSSQPTQRFMLFGEEHSMALDTKTGLSCWTPPLNGKDASYERLEGGTPTMATQGFLPFCADIYRNERRVLKDFDNYMQKQPRETKK
jgi:hypothetical protein